jgi:hypothetical protein
MSGSSTPLFANNAASTLAAALSSSATTATLAAGTGILFPSPSGGQYFALTFVSQTNQMVREIVYVTQMTGDTIADMARGQENTTALSWNAGDFAQALVTAGNLSTIADAATNPLPSPSVTTIASPTITTVVNGQTNVTTISGSTITTVYGAPTSQTWQTVINGGTVTTMRTA